LRFLFIGYPKYCKLNKIDVENILKLFTKNMITKRDIETRTDIEIFIQSFYNKVIVDDTVGIIFTKIFPINWEHHIPLIVDFWETILFDNPVYKKNAMAVHFDINKVFPLQKKHFEAWLYLFNITLDEMFVGVKTTLAKKRADGIAQMMLLKLNTENNK
jgi:hemoglobin